MRSMLPSLTAVVVLFLASDSVRVTAEPSFPGATVETYADVYMPAWISFDRQSGALYTGTEEILAKIKRVGAGGAPVEDYGAVPIQDPDAVLHDRAGRMTGIPGSVLVGGRSGGTPHLLAILPDSAQSVVSVFGPTSLWTNISDMEFDASARLLFGDEDGENGRVLESTGPGQFPAELYAVSGRIAGLEVDPSGRIFTSTFDGRIRIHAPDGSVIADPFVSGLGNRAVPIAIGPGEPWGTDLYTASDRGEIIRVDAMADTTVLGSGFDGFVIDLEFGPDQALYMSDIVLGRIWRVALTSTAVHATGHAPPTAVTWKRVWPNPFRSRTTIQFELAEPRSIRLRVYDARGRLVRTLLQRPTPGGLHAVEWDGNDANGRRAVPGAYFCRLETARAEALARKLLRIP